MLDPIEVIEAIKKNGYPKIIASYSNGGATDKLFAGCSLGQAAYNLNVGPGQVEVALGILVSPESERSEQRFVAFLRSSWGTLFDGKMYLNDYIKFLNDNTDLSVTEIGEIAEKLYLESIA